MEQPQSYRGMAFNEVPESENRIHGDDMAARFGFEGGLVPGVTVSAYLAHPAVVAWGLDYVAGGAAHIVVERPVYDGRPFAVEVVPGRERDYEAALKDDQGSVRARGRCWIPAQAPAPPSRRGDPTAPPASERPSGSPETMRRLQDEGLGAMHIRWSDKAELTSYFSDSKQMPGPLSPDGGRKANLGFVLGLTNWALASSVYIDPWLHLQTDSQCFDAIDYGEDLVVESAIADLFEKKGHHFCDVDVSAYRARDDAPLMHTRLRAIYQLRGA